MTLHFQTLRSSSSGNCLLAWTQRTAVLLDCGIRTQRDCDKLLAGHTGLFGRPDAALISHAHSDHICYSSLKVLQRYAIPLHCHRQIARQIHEDHLTDLDTPPVIRTFDDEPFAIGDLTIQTIAIPHAPGFPNVGFVIQWNAADGMRKMITCSDFYNGEGILQHMIDADFIFVEANYDPELLRRFPNYASRFHMSNSKTAKLLCQARKASRKAPQAVVLGHLSRERNTEALAAGAIRAEFEIQGISMDFRLDVAPRETVSTVVRID